MPLTKHIDIGVFMKCVYFFLKIVFIINSHHTWAAITGICIFTSIFTIWAQKSLWFCIFIVFIFIYFLVCKKSPFGNVINYKQSSIVLFFIILLVLVLRNWIEHCTYHNIYYLSLCWTIIELQSMEICADLPEANVLL